MDTISTPPDSEAFQINDRFDFSSRSLPDLCRSQPVSKISLPRWRSNMEWIGLQGFSGSIPTSGSSTQIASTDSLDNLLPPTIMEEKQMQRFDYTPRSDLFVPEFIPLPSVKSPMPVFNKQPGKVSNSTKLKEGDFEPKISSLINLHNRNSTLQEQRLTSYYQLSYTGEKSHVDRRCNSHETASDGEQEILTTITSLGSSTPTYFPDEDEIIIPISKANRGFVDASSSIDASESEVSPKDDEHRQHPRKRPRRRSENGSLVGNHEGHSSNDTFTLSRPDGSIYKNRRADGTSSSENMARSSSIFVETEDDGYDRTAMSQLLVQVTDLLANPENEDMSLQLRFSPNTRQSLEMEMRQLSAQEQERQLPTLKEILQVNSSRKCHSTNTQELNKLEKELFAFLAGQKEEQDLDPLVTLHRCLASRRVKPPYNRFLQLHLRSLLQHPSVQESEETRNYLLNFLERLGTSPEDIELTPDDGNFLLELITMTNVAIFSPISTPPSIFNHRESPLILAAMRIAAMSIELQKLAESREIVSESQKSMLREAKNLTTAGNNQSCPSAKFYSRVIPHRDRVQLSALVADLMRASKNTPNYKIPNSQASELASLSRQLGEIALVCAKFKVAKAHHIVKNRFRISPPSYQRVCVIGKENHELMADALLLINAAGIANHSEVIGLSNLFNGKSDVELMESDAAYLEHLLTRGIDFQTSRISPWQSLGETAKSGSIVGVKEEPIVPVDLSVVQNPFALSKTPELGDVSSTVISDFFNAKDDNTYENDSLIKPVEATTTLTTLVSHEDLKSSRSDLISNQRTLPTNDAQYYFKLLPETQILGKSISAMQRSPSQLFASKLAPFQIIQLCDCVRKLSSVEPHSEDGKLITKLSIEASRHQKFKLKAKMVGRLRSFYHRIHDPVFKSSFSKLEQIIEKQKAVPVKNEIKLNAENTFSETEICSAALFDKTDSLSLFFLESIKNRCVTRSANTVVLTKAEFIKLSALAQEASAELEAVTNQASPGYTSPDNVARLLCLYKMRALLKVEEGSSPSQISKRFLWRHALTQFLNFYPDKALKSPFSLAAFNIFIEESDHLSDEVREDALKEIQSLIEASEKTVNSSSEAVNSLLSPKTKRQKVIEALKSKFIVSLVNNRQLNCDPTAVGMWISELESLPNDPLSTFLEGKVVEDVKQFLLTQPETQELYETSLNDNIIFSGSDKNLASFEPLELTRMASLTAGIVQTSPGSSLLHILLLEALLKGYDQPKIFVNRNIFAELQGISPELEVNEESIETIEEASDLSEAVDEAKMIDDAHVYVTNLLLDQNKLLSPKLYDNAIKILQKIRSQSMPTLAEIRALRTEISHFEKKINPFLDSDNSLLYEIVSLRALHSRFDTPNAQPINYTELLFVFSAGRNYVSRGSPFYEEISAQIDELRRGLVDGVTVNINLEMVDRLLAILEEKLINDVIATASECISQLSATNSVDNLSLLSTLQFVCIAVVLLQVDIEAKLLAILLCKPISPLSAETRPMVQAVLIEIIKRLQPVTSAKKTKYLRLVAPLLPMALDSDDDQSSVEFHRLLTTVCVANELSDECGGSIGSKLNHKLAEIFWMIFFDQEHLKTRGAFGEFFNSTSTKVSEWLETDSQSSDLFASLFYIAASLPLDKTKTGQLPAEYKDDPFQMESYFCLLQSLLVVTAIMQYTEPQISLTKNQLVTLYHAAVTCIHSEHFHAHLEAKTGLICLLNRIENFYPNGVREQVPLKSIFFDVPSICTLVESALLDGEKNTVENLRSHIAPVILPLGSEAGAPFMTPDPVIVKEGLETSLCGYFSISPTDALLAFQILRKLNYTKLSAADLAITCRILNYLFKDDAGRFKNSVGRISDRVVDIEDDWVQSIAIESAISNLNVFSTMGGLKSEKEVEIFFKSLFTLSSCIGWKESEETLLSGTIVSSPSETYSSFSAKQSTGTDAFHSLESSPMLPKISKETSPEEDSTLKAPIQLDVKSLVGRVDRNPDDTTIENLLNIYHHFHLLLRADKSLGYSTEILTNIIPEFGCLLPSREQNLTASQKGIIEEISLECQNRIEKRFEEVLFAGRGKLSLKILYGYFSMRLPTKIKVPVAAQRLLSLRIARIRRDLTQNELKSYATNNLISGPASSSPETMVLAIQAAQKALEGFTLNLVEQICLFYSIPQEDSILFADLGAAISWMEIWPVQMSPQQRSYLVSKLCQWRQTISDGLDLSKKRSLDPDEICKLATIGMLVEAPSNEVLKMVDSYPGSNDNPKLRRLRESVELPAQDLSESMEFLKEKLSICALDGFTTASNTDIFRLIYGLKLVALSTDWLSSNKETVNETCQKLYLAAACNSSIEDEDAKIELPRKYLHFPELFSALFSHFSNQKRGYLHLEPAAISPQDYQWHTSVSRPKGVHSMETIFGSLKSLRSRTFTRESMLDLDFSGHSTPFKRSSLNRLQELIEIRRAIVAGSKSELDKLDYGLVRARSEAPKIRDRIPDKLDLSLLRRRCEMHTKHLIQRANYEQKQSELYFKLLHHNFGLTPQRTYL
ncbi:hypothetical protein Aperf_G00000101162 [Anoplocephala perfoliata]